jgi:hypothetical protein
MTLRHPYPHQRPLMDSLLTPMRRLSPPTMVHALIAAASLVVSGCATHYQGYTVRSIAYEYADQDPAAHEQRALEAAQDECYIGGDMYAQPVGPPQIVSDGTATSAHFRATLSYYCIGMRGED